MDSQYFLAQQRASTTVEIDRNIMKEQDEAFQAALDTDQPIAHAVSSNEMEKCESEKFDGKASTTELTVEHSKDQQKIDRERRHSMNENLEKSD